MYDCDIWYCADVDFSQNDCELYNAKTCDEGDVKWPVLHEKAR